MESLIPWLAVAAALTLALAGWFYGQRLHKGLRAVRAAAIERYGLEDKNPKGLFPELEGSVEGHRLRVDVVQLAYRSSAESMRKRPWTRVRVDLKSGTHLVVAPRSGANPDSLPTGDVAFDQAYAVTGPENALQKRLGAPQRQSWLAATVPLRLDDGVVSWMQIKHVREPEVLFGAIDECLRLARAMDADPETG